MTLKKIGKAHTRSLALALALLVGVLGGCASQQKKSTTTRPSTSKDDGMMNEDDGMGGGMMATDGMVSRILFVPTGEAATSAVSLEKVAPAEVQLGVPFEYTLTARNLTSEKLEGVSVSDNIPSGMEITSAEPAASSTSGGTSTWDIGDIPAGASRTVRVMAVANEGGLTKYCAQVTYNQLACVTIRVVEPNLVLEKTLDAEALTCDPINARLVVRNDGTGTIRNVVVTSQLPDGLRTMDGGSSMRVEIGDLGPGQSRELNPVMKATRTGTFECTAVATGSGDMRVERMASVTVTEPKLSIEKTGPETTYAQRNVTYEITVKNTGDGVARETVVRDMLPLNSAFVSASDGGQLIGNQVQWNLGTLQADQERTLSLVVKALEIGSITNTAEAMAYCADPVSDRVTTEVKGRPAILLEVVDVEDPIQVGTNVVYVIRVTNQGSATGTNIKITTTLSDEMELVTTSGVTSHSASGRTVEFAPLASLAPKAEAEWRLTIRAAAAGDVRFGVEMVSDQIDSTRPVRETEATNFYE